MGQDYLKGFSINNFRVFGSKTDFQLAPITILTGKNSSGKSSFVKALQLLSKSYKKNGLRKLELMDRDLKLGDFRSIVNSGNNEKDEIDFELEFNGFKVFLCYNDHGLVSFSVTNDQGELLLKTTGSLDQKGYYQLNASFIKLTDEVIDKVSLKSIFTNINEDDFQSVLNSILTFLQNDNAAHNVIDDDEIIHDDDEILENYSYIIDETLNKIIKGLSSIGELGLKNKMYRPATGVIINLKKEAQVPLSVDPLLIDILADDTRHLLENNFKESLNAYLNKDAIKGIKLFPTHLLRDLFSNLEFIGGIRATQEIVYTQENSPFFYKLLDDYYNRVIDSDTMFHDRFFDYLESWLAGKFKWLDLGKRGKADAYKDIKQNFKVEAIPGYGYQIKFKKNDEFVSLSSMGSGVAQFVPILLKMCFGNNRNINNIYIIEEPESNLHPELQSKLADFFVEAVLDWYNNDHPPVSCQVIIETHSEYLIRKFQYLTATPKSILEPVDTVIYYFYHPDSIPYGEHQVKKINILEDGSLTDDFGSGFFDEADKIAMTIWSLNKSQKN